MNYGTSQEPIRTLKPWHLGLLMFAFYLFWGGYFTELSFATQIVFNFAIFYPAGFMAGYFSTRSRLRDVFLTGFLFNCLTYGLAFVGGQSIEVGYVGVDFISMCLWIYTGILVGKRAVR